MRQGRSPRESCAQYLNVRCSTFCAPRTKPADLGFCRGSRVRQPDGLVLWRAGCETSDGNAGDTSATGRTRRGEPAATLQTEAPRRIFCSHGPVGRFPFETSAKVNRPQVRTKDGFVPRRTDGYNTPENKSAPPESPAGRFELI